jgi:hypothetical protein
MTESFAGIECMSKLVTIQKLLQELDLDEAVKHSYLNFHAMGVDYLNLVRSPGYTAKLYLVRAERNKPVVNPHDHAYDFETTILFGNLTNVIYERKGSLACSHYTWTPKINGGDGAKFNGDAWLREKSAIGYEKGQGYSMNIGQIHTIVPRSGIVVMFIEQFRDKLTETNLYEIKDGDIPVSRDLKGFYGKPTALELSAVKRLIEDLIY